MYLPPILPNAKVLITVKTYPLPSNKYDELVCTAGVLPDGKWIRLYPIVFRALPYESQYRKYQWIQLNLIRNSSDFRPESYRPKNGVDEPILEIGKISAQEHDGWEQRKKLVLYEVFDSMTELIERAKGEERKSLATFKPAEIIDFVVEEDEPEWKQEWRDQLKQMSLFDRDENGQGRVRNVVRKLPYKFSYKLLSKGDKKPRQMMIEDWEIGALYWNCLANAEGDQVEAIKMVRQKYFDQFLEKNDIYLFLGTTKQFHLVSPNPFIIVGVFYPPKPKPPKPSKPTTQFMFPELD